MLDYLNIVFPTIHYFEAKISGEMMDEIKSHPVLSIWFNIAKHSLIFCPSPVEVDSRYAIDVLPLLNDRPASASSDLVAEDFHTNAFIVVWIYSP